MDQSFLQTKIFFPHIRSEYITRPRLNKMLDQGLTGKLTLVSAPAGYGKTMLISDWSGRSEILCAWLSLDRYDNDLGRFLGYFAASLRTVGINVGEKILHQIQSDAGIQSSCIIPFINQITSFGQDFILVLDDFHQIEDQVVIQVMLFLLDNLPLNMHLVVITRVDPALRLAKLRAQGVLCEIRAENLRFNQEEAVAFFNQTLKLGLSPADITTVTDKTEGWITGLQLAAISLKNHPDKNAFLTAFAGDDRHIADYLVDEALSRQDSAMQEFLRKTAILEHLCASLCDAITGRNDSGEILIQLEHANLFLIPLDNVREWYRYHHLFRDLLFNRLRQFTSIDGVIALHHAASEWYHSKGRIIEAIHHAFEAGDMKRIVNLIETNIFTMLDQGGIRLLLRWLDSIPETLEVDLTWLNIAHALVLIYAGELDAGKALLEKVEMDMTKQDGEVKIRIKGYICAIKAYSLWIIGSGREALETIESILMTIPKDEQSLLAFAKMVKGAALIQCHDFEGATEVLKESIDLARNTGNDHIHILAYTHMVYSMLIVGEFNCAEKTCLEVIDHYEDKQKPISPAIAQIYTMLGDTYSRRNELDKALYNVQKGCKISKEWEQIDTTTVCYIYLVEIYLARHEFDLALKTMEEIKALSLDVSPWFKEIIEQTEAKIHIATGNIDAASQWVFASGLDLNDEITHSKRNSYRIYAQYLIAVGREFEADQLLNRLIEKMKAIGAKGYWFNLLPMKSLVQLKLGNQEQALHAFFEALEMAEPENNKRSFIQLGESIIPLLRQAIDAGVKPAFVLELLQAIDESPLHVSENISTPKLVEAEEIVVERLSRRELEVLQWIAEGLTNQEIAQELVLSLYTVKSHVRHIFSKLGVKNRTEAVTRGRLLGLIS